MDDGELQGILRGSRSLAQFFRWAAGIALVLGLIGSITEAWSSTHVTFQGQTFAAPDSGAHAFETFLFAFGGVCLAVGVLLFFAYVLDLLRATADPGPAGVAGAVGAAAGPPPASGGPDGTGAVAGTAPGAGVSMAVCPDCGQAVRADPPTPQAKGPMTCPHCGRAHLPYQWTWTRAAVPS